MIEAQPLEIIEQNKLMERVSGMFADKYRLVQIGCGKIKDTYEINYVFDKEYKFQALRIVVPLTAPVIPSISQIYPSAFLYENEMHDLFGITVNNMTLDYKGTFYRTGVTAPFK